MVTYDAVSSPSLYCYSCVPNPSLISVVLKNYSNYFPKGEDKTREFLLEIRSVIDAGLDETPLLEKDVDDDFEYNDDVLMRITMRWFY